MKLAVSLAKLTRPKSSNVLLRKRLFKLLDEACNKPLVWITAPPGAGKTTLVASYLEQKKLPCIWYQIDEGDGDIASFFHYMGIAAKQAAPHHRKPMPNLTPEYLLGLPTFTRNYFRELFSRVSKSQSIKVSKLSDTLTHGHSDTNHRFAIVLDNYQDAPADSPLHEIIQTGLSEIPEGINVIIISRTEPPLAFAGLRANNKMNILGWNELKLSTEETNGIVQLKAHKKLSSEVIQELHNKTNGWAAGLALILEHQGSADLMQRHGKGFTTQAMFDYFAGEIFHKLDAASQKILLQTAFLPIMTARFAQQLTGSHQAGELLYELNRRNYFTIRKSLPEPVYQYHPLFREFLLAQARQQLAPEQLVQTMRRAAEILENIGQTEDAVTLYSHTEDWASMARIILASAQAMITEGRNQMVEEWINNMPESVINETPWLLYWRGVCSISFAPKMAKEDMEKAYYLFHKLNDHAGVFLAWTGVIDSIFNQGENFSLLDPWIDSLDVFLKECRSFPSPEIEFRVTVSMFVAMLWRRLGHPDIKIWKERAFSVLSRCEDKTLRIQLLTFLSIYYMWRGDFVTAKKLVNAMRDMSESKEIPPFLAIWVKTTEAMYEWLTASFDSCFKTAAEGIKMADITGIHIWDTHLLEHTVAAALSTGDLITAKNIFKKLKPFSEKLRLVDRSYYEYLKAWEAIIRKDPSSYPDYIELHQMNENLGLKFGDALLHETLTQLSHERGDEKAASEHLSKLIKVASEIDSRYIEYVAYILEAQISFDREEDDKGLASLKNAMAIGKRQGFMNFHSWCPDVMAMLCARALDHGIEVEYVQSLIRRRKLIPPIDEIEIENWPWPVRIYTLGRFGIVKDGKPLRFTEKAKHTPLKLLKAIIALGGRDIGAEAVIDTLWPDADGDTGLRSLNTTLHRLRKLLGNDLAITLEDNRLSIDVRHIWVDVFAFQRLLGKIENTFKKAEAKDDNLMERVIAMYQGPFLRDISEQWALLFRERLKNRYLYILAEIAQRFEKFKDWQKTIQCCEKCIEIDNISEENYRRLMTVYNKLGRKSEGLAVYKRCKEALNLHLGISPSQETEAIHKSLRS